MATGLGQFADPDIGRGGGATGGAAELEHGRPASHKQTRIYRNPSIGFSSLDQNLTEDLEEEGVEVIDDEELRL